MRLIIDKESSIPIYKQIVFQFEELIKSGVYKENDKLPTERELLMENNIAKGTIKHAYSELETMHYVSKKQGSGTYVLSSIEYNPLIQGEHMVRDIFDKLSFAGAEDIYRIFDNELYLKFKDKACVNMAWIDCSPEVLRVTERQILKISNLRVTKLLIDDIGENNKLLDNSYDIITTTQSHYDELQKLIPITASPIEKLGLSVSDLTIAEISKIPNDSEIAILYESNHFLDNIIDKLNMLDKKNKVRAYRIPCDIYEFQNCLAEAGALLVPSDYLNNVSGDIINIIEKFKLKNKVIPFEYLIDRGSLYHLEMKIEECFEKKYRKRIEDTREL